MKKYSLLSMTILFSNAGFCCVTCNKQVQEAIFNSSFYPNLFTMLSAFIAIAVIVIVLSWLSTKRYSARKVAAPHLQELAAVPLTSAATVLGIGIGGFIDGIVLHQILQWHEMLSAKMPPDTLVAKSVNMFWDGIFHAFTLIVTIVGISLLWRLLNKVNINRSGYLLTGGMLIGWGLFNLVEGIIDHHILKLHNVRELSPNHDLWNYGFLIFSVILLIIGWSLTRISKKRAITF